MVQRQLPNPAELLELMKFKKPEFDGKKRRLNSALTISDLRDIAKRRTPKAAFDYTDGAAEGELSLSRARRSRRCRRHPLHPVDARHHLDRGCEGGEPGWPQLVPAVRDARPRDLLR